MGHSFGSLHDTGTNKTTVTCPSALNYIMSPAPSLTNPVQQFFFSNCSIAMFEATLLTQSRYVDPSHKL
jgi:hypothetical protein